MIEPFDHKDQRGRGLARIGATREQVLEPDCRKGPWPPWEQRPRIELTEEEYDAFWRAITEEC
jgi:hypothetical protein